MMRWRRMGKGVWVHKMTGGSDGEETKEERDGV